MRVTCCLKTEQPEKHQNFTDAMEDMRNTARLPSASRQLKRD